MKCIYCEQEFEQKPTGKSGGYNRQLCYKCLPEGCTKETSHNIAKLYLVKRTREEKRKIGCSNCGYNKCGRALEWHHVNDDKEYNVSVLLNKGNREGLDLYYNEISKCILLCANCHRELHEREESELILPEGSDEYELFRQKVRDTYLRTKSLKATSKILHKCEDSIKKILKYYNIPIENGKAKVLMLNKDTLEPIYEFDSITAASKYLGKGRIGSAHISEVCRGIRKSAYGYIWSYVD